MTGGGREEVRTERSVDLRGSLRGAKAPWGGSLTSPQGSRNVPTSRCAGTRGVPPESPQARPEPQATGTRRLVSARAAWSGRGRPARLAQPAGPAAPAPALPPGWRGGGKARHPRSGGEGRPAPEGGAEPRGQGGTGPGPLRGWQNREGSAPRPVSREGPPPAAPLKRAEPRNPVRPRLSGLRGEGGRLEGALGSQAGRSARRAPGAPSAKRVSSRPRGRACPAGRPGSGGRAH